MGLLIQPIVHPLPIRFLIRLVKTIDRTTFFLFSYWLASWSDHFLSTPLSRSDHRRSLYREVHT
ncbi:hypothetical protein SERLA73DRAFT_187852 [Serpula lacrymans var. lacrymans S7.3]|uniref:Uncharacterized protein n=1 Tax=Serpula lacrymans var. lacrymans (strain S7.3) TaxID=936435 RepID=F8QAK4_SERL3|nr:hypothetical protein SERLA73DRAFT_187852 [Serpula lacrymans var. lacrymans S7.3]